MPIAGGAVATLTDAATGRGAAWDLNGEDPVPVEHPAPVASRASHRGGRAHGSRNHACAWRHDPSVAPDPAPEAGCSIRATPTCRTGTAAPSRIETAPGTPGTIVVRGGYHGRYVPTGHLLYVYAGTLYGVRFDLDRLEATSAPVPVIDRLMATPISGSAQYSFASNGTLAYVPGNPTSVDAQNPLADRPRRDVPARHDARRVGQSAVLARRQAHRAAGRLRAPRADRHLRPGHRSADAADVRRGEPPVSDLERGRPAYRGTARMPVERAHRTCIGGAPTAPGDARRLTTSPGTQVANSMHPSGRSIWTRKPVGATPSALWLLPLQGSPEEGWTPGTARALGSATTFEALGRALPGRSSRGVHVGRPRPL